MLDNMRRVVFCLSIGFVSLTCAQLALAGEPIDKSQPVASDAQVKISNVRGKVTVRGAEKDTQVLLIKGMLAEKAKLNVTGDEKNISIVVETPGNHSWWGSSEAEDTILEITLPQSVSLAIETVSADIDVSNLAQSKKLKIETVSGDQKITASVAEFEISSVSGDLNLQGDASETDIETISGDMEIADVQGIVSIESVSGDVTLRTNKIIKQLNGSSISGDFNIEMAVTKTTRIEAETTSGDVILKLAGELSTHIEVETTSGDISSDWGNVKEEEYGPGAELDTTIGNAEGRIRLTSMSGDITVRK